MFDRAGQVHHPRTGSGFATYYLNLSSSGEDVLPSTSPGVHRRVADDGDSGEIEGGTHPRCRDVVDGPSTSRYVPGHPLPVVRAPVFDVPGRDSVLL